MSSNIRIRHQLRYLQQLRQSPPIFAGDILEIYLIHVYILEIYLIYAYILEILPIEQFTRCLQRIVCNCPPPFPFRSRGIGFPFLFFISRSLIWNMIFQTFRTWLFLRYSLIICRPFHRLPQFLIFGSIKNYIFLLLKRTSESRENIE